MILYRMTEDAVQNSIEQPTRKHKTDAGIDLRSIMNIRVCSGEIATIPTGVEVAIPKGYFGMIADRSSMAKMGLKTLGGIIDSGYRGEIKVMMTCLIDSVYWVAENERCAQLIILPYSDDGPLRVARLPDADRGNNGFGSTGKF